MISNRSEVLDASIALEATAPVQRIRRCLDKVNYLVDTMHNAGRVPAAAPRSSWRPGLRLSCLSCTCGTDAQYQTAIVRGLAPSCREINLHLHECTKIHQSVGTVPKSLLVPCRSELTTRISLPLDDDYSCMPPLLGATFMPSACATSLLLYLPASRRGCPCLLSIELPRAVF